MSLSDGTQAALNARRELGLGDDSPLPDILRLIETSGVLCFGLPFGTGGIDGAYQVARDQPFLLFNVEKAPQRQRFTIAHEFGHHKLGHGARPDEVIDPNSKDPREREANAFAATFLMPGPAVERWLEAHEAIGQVDLEVVVRIAADFGVSAQAMRYRLETLDRLKGVKLRRVDDAIRLRQHTALARSLKIANLRDTVADAYAVGVWLPTEHQQTLLGLLDAGRVSEEVVARQLPDGVGLEQLKTLARPDSELEAEAVEL